MALFEPDTRPFGIIYRIRHVESGTCYIGQTYSKTRETPEAKLANRWSQHVYEAHKGTNNRLYNAIRKYGVDAFEREIVCVCSTREELNDREKHYIAEENLCEVGYNIKEGGDSYGQAPETCQKIGDALRNKPKSEEHCRALSDAAFARVYTDPDARNEKIRQAHLGRPKSPEHIEKVALANMAITDPAILAEIRAKDGSISRKALATLYGVSYDTIRNIVLRRKGYATR